MNKRDQERFQRELMARREALVNDVRLLEQEILHSRVSGAVRDRGGMPNHMAELASDAFNEDLGIEALEKKEAEVRAIDKALSRMVSGRYGICDNCSEPIPVARLRALPQAQYCLVCQQRLEQQNYF